MYLVSAVKTRTGNNLHRTRAPEMRVGLGGYILVRSRHSIRMKKSKVRPAEVFCRWAHFHSKLTRKFTWISHPTLTVAI